MNFRPALVGGTEHLQRRHFNAVLDLHDPVNDHTTVEFDEVFLTVASDRQSQPFRQGIDARHANAVKAAGNLVAVLVAFTAGMQRSEEHTSELQSLMRISYAVFCLKKKK